MDTKFNTLIQIELEPEGQFPKISYGLNIIEHTVELKEKILITIDQDLKIGEHKFILNFFNKTNSNPDLAVKINSVVIEGIYTDRFKWQGKYRPDYPEPWASQQNKKLDPVIDAATYLGWNGQWELSFTVPIFTWIHKIENLGWIYD